MKKSGFAKGVIWTISITLVCVIILAAVGIVAYNGYEKAALTYSSGESETKITLEKKKKNSEPAKVSETESTQTIEKETIPEWFIKPPQGSDTLLYVRGTAISDQLQLALDLATNAALKELGKKIETRLASKSKVIIRQAGIGEDQVSKTEINLISSTVVNEVTISGYEIVNTHIVPLDNGRYRSYILLEYSLAEVYKTFINRVKKEIAKKETKILPKKLKFTEHGSFYGIKKDGKMVRGIQIGPETDTGQSTWYGTFTKSQGYWKGYFAHSYPDGRKLYNYNHYKLDSDGNLIVDKDGIYEFVDTYPISEKDFEKVKEYIFLDMDFPFSFYDFEELKPKITINIEEIEKMYADGSINKAECIRAKSDVLKLPSVSKTICNNVVSKVEAEAEKVYTKRIAKKERKKKDYYYDEKLPAIDPYESSISKESSDFEPPKGERDLTPPTIKVASKIESKDPNYFIEGTVIDTGGSKKGPYLFVDDEKIELDKNGKFSVRKYSPTNDQITVVAYDGNGNVTEKFVNVIIISSKKGKYYALVIGNNDYQHLEKLDAAENDAREIGKVLEHKYEFEVTHLYNATRKDTVKEMHYISRKLNNEDSLLIYYAGHGIFDKDENEGYWLPVDAVKNTSAEGIGNAWITKQVKATKARHVLLLIDSCFAGSITKTRSASNLVPREELDLRFIERKSSKKSRTVITSGGNEPVVDSDGGDHSWFAKKLLEILNENNDVVYSLNIYDELQKYVINNADQTPVMAIIQGTGHNDGEFFFYSKN